MGSVIVQEVLRDLLGQGLTNASKLMLTGSSAGGIGVLLNLDRAADFLRNQGSTAEVRGIADSGWFLDNVPYAPADCFDPQRCAPATAVQLGHALWAGQVPLACKAQYASQPWRCYFGHHLHRTLKSNAKIVNLHIDEQQLIDKLFISSIVRLPMAVRRGSDDSGQRGSAHVQGTMGLHPRRR
jgi:O-palmitoleoyl-L-serine hydrolase